MQDLRSLERAGVIGSDINVEAMELVRLAAHHPCTPKVICKGSYKMLATL